MTTLLRFAYDLEVYGTAIAELTGIARIELRPTGHWRITSIVLDARHGRSLVLPHTHTLHEAITSWLRIERREEIEEKLRRQVGRDWMGAA